MNYRHAYHAGNFGDCMKHALLVWLLAAMQKKPGAIFALDTHAGIGRYDLAEGPATRTGEWQSGIARLLDNPPLELADYVALVKQEGLYPGSPAIIQAMLRPQDRLACCELHPEDLITLRRNFGRDPQISVHGRDAWEALGALLPPPKERRALILIDPPYEASDEFYRLTDGLKRGHARFPTGVFAAWYPIKHRAPTRAFHNAMQQSGIKDIVVAEFWLRPAIDAARLNGCGLLVINPPYGFEAAASDIMAALVARLADDFDAGFDVARIVNE